MAAEATAAHDQEHPSILGHHFDDIEQQRSTMRFGMWIFLVTELLFFGGVFVAYAAYRYWYPAAWAAGSKELNWMIAAINSFLLLTSSLTITFAIHYARRGERKSMVWCLGLTWLLGVAFLAFKATEYTEDYYHGLIPGSMFNEAAFSGGHDSEHGGGSAAAGESGTAQYDKSFVKQVQLFYCFYYCMTGIHVIHLIIGIGLVIWLWLEARRGEITPERFVKVEVISLYWHFVDLIWLFIVPTLYLAGQQEGFAQPFLDLSGHH